MSCSCLGFVLCDPNNGDALVHRIVDASNGTVAEYNFDGTPFTGDSSALAVCDGATGFDPATLSAALNGDGGVAETAARSDHRHAQSRGAILPPVDGSGGVLHILIGHATLPNDLYYLDVDTAGDNIWTRV